MKKTDLAWAAGIIDGEGCIHISRSPSSTHTHATTLRHALYLKITMCHRPTVTHLQKLFQLGTIQKAQRSHHTSAHTWLCCGKTAAHVLLQCFPYFVTKVKEADIAIAFVNLPKAKRGGKGGTQETPIKLLRQRDRLCLRLRKLKTSYRFRPVPLAFEEIMKL